MKTCLVELFEVAEQEGATATCQKLKEFHDELRGLIKYCEGWLDSCDEEDVSKFTWEIETYRDLLGEGEDDGDFGELFWRKKAREWRQRKKEDK